MIKIRGSLVVLLVRQLLVAVAVLGACLAEEVPKPRAVFRSSSAVGDPTNWHASFSYDSPDGTVREETMLLKRIDDKVVPEIKGRSSWVDKQSEKKIELTYEADEQGFHAEGEHIPKPEPPAVPVQVESGKQTVIAVEPHVTPTSKVPLPPPPPPSSPARKTVGHRFIE
ncbi:larval cuticle protein 65Ab1-like [Schistocerca piceifrons]|uniref:larval cuticle protein 65Ab1-like n=1 Tax=Schistocerca piceifrons TaxID=274613 RepID=UPI001F5ED371|nr:larval cuticle protein 65Ab1-like [Schistocerca piceifrons]